MRRYLTLSLGALASLAPISAPAAPTSMLHTMPPAETRPPTESRGLSWLTKWFRHEEPEVPQFVRPAAPAPAVMAYQPPPSTAVVPPAGAGATAPAPKPLPPTAPAAANRGATADCKTLRQEGHAKDRAGDLVAAEALYRRAIGADPTSAAAVNDLGLCLARQGKLEPSAAVFRQAIMMRPDKPLYRNNIATVLVELDEPGEALANLKTVYRPAAAQHNLGQLLARAGRTDEAVAAFREALAQEPTLAPAREALAGLTPQPAAVAATTPSLDDEPAADAELLNPPGSTAPAYRPTQVAAAPPRTAAPARVAPEPVDESLDEAGDDGVPSFPRLLPPVLDR